MRELPVGPERSWLTARYREMAQAAHSIGAGFAVVAFPHAGQVTGELSGLLQEQVVEIGRNEGWPTLDLVPAFRNAASNKDVPPLLLDLWHPSAEGHSIAARETAAWLEREQLLTQSPR